MKTKFKNMHRIKSYGENKILSHNMAISFAFLPNFRPKMAYPEEALPSGFFPIFYQTIWAKEVSILMLIVQLGADSQV